MRMGQYGVIDAIPRINIKVTCRTVKTTTGAFEQIGVAHAWSLGLSPQKNTPRFAGGVLVFRIFVSRILVALQGLGSSLRRLELPSEVSKGFVGISHAVGVLAFGDRCAFFAVSGHEFIS